MTERFSRITSAAFFSLCVILLFSPAGSYSQQPVYPPVVGNIVIMGNNSTDEEIIRRELLFTEGDTLNDSMLVISENRLNNLLLFNRVEINLIPAQDRVIVLIQVTERLYIFPYPVLQLEDRDWNKITYGFGIVHENFRGRNEKLAANVLFGNRPGFNIKYYNPWFGGKAHLSGGIFLKKFQMDNRLYGFSERHFDMDFFFGKNWTYYFSNRIALGRIDISVDKAYAGYFQNQTREINNYVVLSTLYDKRDIYAYPTTGFFFKNEIGYFGLFNDKLNYWKFLFDIRKYAHWKSLIFAGRFYTLQTVGDLPVYDLVYIGFGERVRGHFYEVYYGRHAMIASLELRYPIISTRYYTIPVQYVPPLFTQNLKFGINAGLFYDAGMSWGYDRAFVKENLIQGFGAGLHIRLPYIEVFRIEAAFNEQFRIEYIFEVRISF